MLKEKFRKVEPFKMNLQLFAEDPPGGDPPAPAEPPKVDPPGGKGNLFTEDYVKTLRGEAAGYRIQLQAIKKSLKDELGIELGDDPVETLTQFKQKQVDAAEEAINKAKDLLLRVEVEKLKAELGIRDMEVAMALVDKSKVEVKDDGAVEGLKDQLEALLEQKPYLKDTTPTPGGGNPPRGAGGSTDSAVDKAKEMALKRNKKSGGNDPWNPSSGSDPQSIAQAIKDALSELGKGGA